MRDKRFYVEQAWRWKCGLPEEEERPKKEVVDLEKLKKTEWSNKFEQLMRNRLLMGALRYGKMAHTPEELAKKPTYDRVDSCLRRLEKYKQTGNKEYLVDVANLCLLEFVECKHPLGHFQAIDDTPEHQRVVVK